MFICHKPRMRFQSELTYIGKMKRIWHIYISIWNTLPEHVKSKNNYLYIYGCYIFQHESRCHWKTMYRINGLKLFAYLRLLIQQESRWHYLLELQVALLLSQCTGVFLSSFPLPTYYRSMKLTLTQATLFIILGYTVLIVDIKYGQLSRAISPCLHCSRVVP